MNLRLLGAAIAASFALLCAGNAGAATFKPIAKGKSLVMTGIVEEGDVQRLLEAATASERKRGYAPERIFLNSPGGNVIAGVEVAEFIREWGIHTVVGRTDTCASICVAIFAAGSHKVVFPTSQLGVHSASYYDAYSGQEGEALETSMLLARYMADLGVPDAVIIKMIRTPGNDISWIKADDWPTLEILEGETAGYVAPNEPHEPQTPTLEILEGETAGYVAPNEPHEPQTTSMTCLGERDQYVVSWTGAGMQVRDRWYVVNESHQSPKTGAWVATGPTKFGGYSAVFGGPNPRMEFWNGKEKVTDNCWS